MKLSFDFLSSCYRHLQSACLSSARLNFFHLSRSELIERSFVFRSTRHRCSRKSSSCRSISAIYICSILHGFASHYEALLISFRRRCRRYFSQVCIVQKRDTGCLYAMKYVSRGLLDGRGALGGVIKEVELLSSLEHPFLVNLWFSFQGEPSSPSTLHYSF